MLHELEPGAPYAAPQLLLYRLRDASWLAADIAIAALDEMRGLWWFDGANAEAAADIRHELELVRDASSNMRVER
jgi:hypothetical protein